MYKLLLAVLSLFHMYNVKELVDEMHTNNTVQIEAILLGKPSLINAQDDDDPLAKTPLHYSALHGYKEMAQLLITKGAYVNAQDRFGKTPLHWAALHNKKEVAQLLINSGAYVNAQDRDGKTPLHWAAYYFYKDIVELLIEQPTCNLELKSKDGKTALEIAQEGEQHPLQLQAQMYKEIVQIIKTKLKELEIKRKGKLPQWAQQFKKPFSDIRFEEKEQVNHV